MKRFAFFLAAALLVFPAAADVGIGEDLGIFQDFRGSEINFTQQKNFTSLDIFPYTTGFETSNFTASTLPYDPVAYYPLDGSGEDLVGDSDITGGSADLKKGVLGGSGEARYFDGSGSDYLRVENPDFGIADSQSVTVSMWQKGDGQPTKDESFAGHDAEGNQRQIFAHAPWRDEKIYWDTTETFDGDGSRISGTPSGSVDWDQWHHYLFVHNANTGRKEIWFDGTRIASSSSETQTFEEIVEFYIGSGGGSESRPRSYQGRIDNLAIYNRSLTDSEIQYVYENTFGAETDIQMDFYEYNAGLQSYVSNFSAQTDSNTAHFKAGNLPGDLFYEAFDSVTGERFYIGYTRNDVFNFTVPEFTSEEISIFHYGEKGVAIDNITFNDSEPVEGETLGIEEEIFNEGVVDDEAVNKTLTISTYNGSGWQQKQFRSEDLAVPVNGTETQQTFTAQFRGSFTNTTQYRNGGGQLGLGYQNGTAGDSLVGYWRMDKSISNGGTVLDYAGEGNDGTLNTGGNTVSGAQGTFSTNAFDFDGTDDEVEVPDPATDLSDAFTVSVWVKLKSGASGEYAPLVEKNGASSNNFPAPFDIRTNNGGFPKNAFILYGESGTSNSLSAANVFPQGEWVHVGVTAHSTNGGKLYINGVEKDSNTATTFTDEDKKILFGQRLDNLNFAEAVLDEVRIYNRSLSDSEVKDLYFHGAPFHGSYTTEEIQEGELTHWYRVNLDANIPDQTELDAEFRALDSDGNVVDTDSFVVEDGDNYYNVSVQDSEGAKLYLNGSSQKVEKSWEVNQLQIISGGPYVDEWKVKPGPWRFNVSLDPNDKVKETNETNNEFTESLNVDSYQLVHGGTDLRLELGVNTDDLYIWNPSKEEGFLYFSDVDSSFSFSDLRPVNGSEFPQVDRNLSMVGHNDSVEELWDDDNDGYADHIRSWNVAGNELDVPVVNSSSAGTFETGILYDTGDGSPYDGSQDLVFVTKLKPATAGKNGVYDYEARIPYGLRSLRPNDDSVRIYQELK